MMHHPNPHTPQSMPGLLTVSGEYSDAWTAFFEECRRLATLARQRRAEREAQANAEPTGETQTA